MTEDSKDPLAGVPLGLLRRYLLLHKWHSPTKQPEGLDLFLQSGEEANIEIVLPKTTEAPDAERWVNAAVRTLAQLTGSGVGQILDEVRSIGADVFRSRLPDQLVRHDTVDLEVASSFVEKMRRLLAAAATTEISPERLFGRVRKEGQEYADHCRFGHTFKGSFGFTIESPISPNEAPTLDTMEQTPPFERRVVQRIVRGIKTVATAARLEDPAEIVAAYKTGFSANMCDEFASILELTPGSPISFGLVLSPEWSPPSDLKRVFQIEIRPQGLDVVKAAATQLRKQEFDRDRIIVGRVTRLKSNQDPSDLANPAGREITVTWVTPDLGSLNVKLVLEPVDYLIAVEAHRTGRLLSASGTLDKIGRRSWTLIRPRSIAVL